MRFDRKVTEAEVTMGTIKPSCLIIYQKNIVIVSANFSAIRVFGTTLQFTEFMESDTSLKHEQGSL